MGAMVPAFGFRGTEARSPGVAVTVRGRCPYHVETMPEITTLHKPLYASHAPSGAAALDVRKRYLRRRSQRRRLGDRGLTALWVAVGALVSWLFVVGFATLAH
jgi:hypothetical protein